MYSLLEGISHRISPQHTPPNISPYYLAQDLLVWEQVMLGLIDLTGCKTQANHLKSIKYQCYTLWWTFDLIKKLWDTSWDPWQHRNHFIHAQASKENIRLLQLIQYWITYHKNQGGFWLPICHQLILRTSLISIPAKHAFGHLRIAIFRGQDNNSIIQNICFSA